MSTSDFTLAFILLFTLQGCTSQVCKPYEDSAIKDDCDKLIIEGGTVCYIERWRRWVAHITCLDGYDVIGTPTRTCRYSGSTRTSTWDESKPNCEREQMSTASQTSEQMSTTSQTSEQRSTASQTSEQRSTASQTSEQRSTGSQTSEQRSTASQTSEQKSTVSQTSEQWSTASQTSEQRSTTSQTSVSEKRGSLSVVYITVPAVAIVILVFVLVVLFCRRRKLAAYNVRSNNQNDRTSAVFNNAYEYNADVRDKNSTPPGRVDNNDSEYFTIPDSVDQNTVGREYSTLHMGERCYNTPNYNHLPLRSDTYDHTTSTVGNVQKMTDTYSHLNDASHDNNSNDWNKETGDVYNKLGADGQCVKAIELDPASTESDECTF